MTGLRKTPHGWQAYLRVNGDFYAKRFPSDTPVREMQLWRSEKRLRVLGRLPPDPTYAGDTFAADVAQYLQAVGSMASYNDRARDLGYWLEALGRTRTRASITAVDIRRVLEQWRQVYTPSTCNHRRTALMHLFTVLDGKSAPNPVKDVPRYREESQDLPPRTIPLDAIRALLKAMQPSATKYRLELMAWTGWPQAQIGRIEPDDIDRLNKRVFLRGRKKGRGVKGRWMPMLPEAWAALLRLVRWGGLGPFSASSMRQRMLHYAAKLAKDRKQPKAIRTALQDVRPYDLRHSFAVMVVLATADERAAQHLLIHSDLRQTARYTRAATETRVANALTAVANLTKRA